MEQRERSAWYLVFSLFFFYLFLIVFFLLFLSLFISLFHVFECLGYRISHYPSLYIYFHVILDSES